MTDNFDRIGRIMDEKMGRTPEQKAERIEKMKTIDWNAVYDDTDEIRARLELRSAKEGQGDSWEKFCRSIATLYEFWAKYGTRHPAMNEFVDETLKRYDEWLD